MNGTMLLDKKLASRGELLRPHFGIHDLSRLGEFTGAIKLPDVITSTIANWVNRCVNIFK